jgi:hypothetical protein
MLGHLCLMFSRARALIFAYVLRQERPAFDGTNPGVVTSDGAEACAVIVVSRYHTLRFGPPNDETISGHRLYRLGLKAYSAFEVKNSSWIAELEAANRVHQHHRAEVYRAMRHFIFTFHDTTLEFVAGGYSADVKRGLLKDVLLNALARI